MSCEGPSSSRHGGDAPTGRGRWRHLAPSSGASKGTWSGRAGQNGSAHRANLPDLAGRERWRWDERTVWGRRDQDWRLRRAPTSEYVKITKGELAVSVMPPTPDGVAHQRSGLGSPRSPSSHQCLPYARPLALFVSRSSPPEGASSPHPRQCSLCRLSARPRGQARVCARGSPVVECSARRPSAEYTKATVLEKGDASAASARRSWGEMRALGGHPYHGVQRDLDQQLGRTRAREWAGRMGKAGRSNEG
jgi:hypothetical protein